MLVIGLLLRHRETFPWADATRGAAVAEQEGRTAGFPCEWPGSSAGNLLEVPGFSGFVLDGWRQPRNVISAKAGTQGNRKTLAALDSRLRGNDGEISGL